MSLLSDTDICDKMVSEERNQKSCLVDYNTSEFVVLPKCEEIEETLIVGEEIVVDTNADENEDESEDANLQIKGTTLYFGEKLNASTQIAAQYMEHCSSTPVSTPVISKWDDETMSDHSLMMPDTEENTAEYECHEDAEEDQDGDEETIATFVTAAGQQLALYAVEDSEEIFAVAVYDESGEPPTNFQFLMKADVERLIGEGAVRTVKKPTQIKKQLLTTQPPLLFSKDSMRQITMNSDAKCTLDDIHINRHNHGWEKGMNLPGNGSLELNMKANSNIIYSHGKQSDVAYLMMENHGYIDQYEDNQEDTDSDNDIIEQSTVQYIFFEGDQSDSELTFDEIQATLQNLKSSGSKLHRKSVNTKSYKEQNSSNRIMIMSSNANKLADAQKQHMVTRISPVVSSDLEYHVQHSPDRDIENNGSDCLSERKRILLNEREDLLHTLGDSLSTTNSDSPKLNSADTSIDCGLPQSEQITLKAKRSRKQQLTSVNRDDSEIIIQPASLLTEEDNTARKRGKRRRRVVAHSATHSRDSDARRTKKFKNKEVEVIEIDVDEEDRMAQGKQDVVEITLDDSKDKCSSDKENEIIMVGDSDDESRETDTQLLPTFLQCEHCSRNFRHHRALDTHLRVCAKSASNALKSGVQKSKQRSAEGDMQIKKHYACKICQEKFDVVVALARHVRSVHSQRKKRRQSKSSVDEESEDSFVTEEARSKVRILKRTKTKRNSTSWLRSDVKKLSCIDCGRWFPSAALLRAHCLQHGTKKSERQIRRCQICNKLIKSRLLFIRHLKMHSNASQNAKSGNSALQKKVQTTRQVTRKIMSLRKRGRPRKF